MANQVGNLSNSHFKENLNDFSRRQTHTQNQRRNIKEKIKKESRENLRNTFFI